MSEWRPKRFWKVAGVTAAPDGFAVVLDGRPVRTPAKAALEVPSRPLAEAIAAEWDAQVDKVAPETMPLTRTANSAIDKVARDHAAVVAILAEYGATDLLSYRATAPDALAARQAEAWDPWIDWAARDLGTPLRVTQGVMFVNQPEDSLVRLGTAVGALDTFELAAFHDLVALSGSLVLGLAIAAGRLDAETAWSLSRIDEDWQEELWGHDEEAAAKAAVRRAGFLDAARFLALCRRRD